MKRRNFIKNSILAGAAAGISLTTGKLDRLFAEEYKSEPIKYPDIVAVKGSTPDRMFDKGIAAIGGIKRFVKKGNNVVIKPNIAWNASPDMASTTNPLLVKQIIKHCLDAGAKNVYVFDHTCNHWGYCYKNSGIEKYSKNAGAKVVPGNDNKYYHKVIIPGALILKTVKVHELILESDVFINVPILKHHSGSQVTIAMKNLMGIVWDRREYHSGGLDECIAEFCLYGKPALNVVDAYRVLMRNGPWGKSIKDSVLKKTLLISTDIVAVDAAGTKIFGAEPGDIPYLKYAERMKIGTMDLNKLNIKKIRIT